MSADSSKSSSTAASSLNYEDTALTLGLPAFADTERKRGFSETVDLNLGHSPAGAEAKDGAVDASSSPVAARAAKQPAAKAQLVGWPPVRSFRRNVMKSCTYVKVAVDGAPYLRKVDLEAYNGYQQLMAALEEMFSCFTLRNCPDKSRLVDPTNGTEYVPTYEDKDGDWMLVGDVPWNMFITSCKRLRLMKSSEAVNLEPRPSQGCTSTR